MIRGDSTAGPTKAAEEIGWDPSAPYGERGAYRKITVTLPQQMYERLVGESARRKIAGQPNQLLSAILREALSRYLDEIASNS